MLRNRTIFLTGATGFLGSHLLARLLRQDNKVYVIARGKKGKDARKRVREALAFWDPGLPAVSLRKKLRVIEGDLSDVGERNPALAPVLREAEFIIHGAALPELNVRLDILRAINVEGTRRVMEFAAACAGKGRLRKVGHVSTAFVAGDGRGPFSEGMLDNGQGFNNTYERSKFEAELLVAGFVRKGLNAAVFRPSMVIGERGEGKTSSFRLFYEPLHFFSKRLFDEFPAGGKARLNLIHVDTVTEAIDCLMELDGPGVYHLTSKENVGVRDLLSSAAAYFRFPLPALRSAETFDQSSWSPVQRALAKAFVPYFNYAVRFDSRLTRRVLARHGVVFPEINDAVLRKAFRYCRRCGFIK